MTAAGATVEEIARKWGRPRKWVQSRHDAACLGKEVLEAIERPGRDRLTMEAVEEILKVPPVLWTEAVKLVLHPVMGTLDAEDARDVMRRCLKEPQAEEDNWRKLTPKLATEWRKRLRKQCLRGTASSLRVEVPSWRAAENMRGGFANAEELVGSSLPNAPADLLWLHVAVRHGLPVQIVPPDPHEGIRALVDRRRLQEAEAARSGLESEPWPAISKQKPGVESLERTPAITGSSRRKAVTPWEWPTATQADIIKIPSIQLGQWRGREISIRPTEDGHCEWVGIEDEKAVQRDWLKGIRKEKGWPWIQTVAKIAVRHWENLEQGRRPLPFAKAAWIHYRAHSGASGAE